MRNIAILVLVYFAECVVYPSIPAHLLECYRGGGPAVAAPRRLDVFLSLLRTLEDNSQLDVRTFSAALLRSLRLDGIEQAANPIETEYVTPYRASAFQFHKYKLLMDLFVPSQNTLEVDGILTAEEKCLLHRMLSSSVFQWERGDESVACPLSLEQRVDMLTTPTANTTRPRDVDKLRAHKTAYNNSMSQSLVEMAAIHRANLVVSRCPIEEGVIQTAWGTVSPGTVVAAVAAALQAQRVSVSDILNADVFKAGLAEPMMDDSERWEDNIETLATAKSLLQIPNADISNVWVATLAGDLSEVAVNQGPRVGSAAQRMRVGSSSRWNDTVLPRAHYLLPQNTSAGVDWHFTDAEILAGIDGLILSQYVTAWVSQRNSLRLSQILDMYYSSDNPFEPTVTACGRRALYDKVFDRSVLLAEMSSFAQVLSLSQGTVYMQADELDRISEAAVAAYVAYVPTVLSAAECPARATWPRVPVMDLVLATDGAWKGYDVEQFVSWLGGAMEVGLNRGSLSLLHGNTGAWIAPPSDNLTAVFSHTSNFTGSWPDRLNFPNIMSTIIQHARNQSLRESTEGASVAPATVVLLISPSDRLSANEVETSRQLMTSLRSSFHDVYFAYLAQDLTGFENVNNEYTDYSELFLKVDSTSVQDAIASVKTDLLERGVPMKIIGAHCPVNGTEFPQRPHEDFVVPGRSNEYRIHPYYLREQMVVSVVVRNSGGGTLLACWWRGADSVRECRALPPRQHLALNLTAPCPSQEFCVPARITVAARDTLNLCANTDCRLPHQVGYYMEHTGLRCLALRNSADKIWPSCMIMIVVYGWILVLVVTKLDYKTK